MPEKPLMQICPKRYEIGKVNNLKMITFAFCFLRNNNNINPKSGYAFS